MPGHLPADGQFDNSAGKQIDKEQAIARRIPERAFAVVSDHPGDSFSFQHFSTIWPSTVRTCFSD